MKYIMILGALLLSGCYQSKACPNKDFRDFHYMNPVNITSGFYSRQTGKVIDRSWEYDQECNVPAFKVKLDSTGEQVIINQIFLERY